MTRAVIDARYSSDNQSAASIEDQVRECREFVARQGWTVAQVYTDAALSGASTLRPGYQALLAAARDGGLDVVVAEALDRLSRDQEDTAALFKRLRFAGIRLVTLSEGEISELHVGLKGTMNALFLRDLAAKTHRGLRGRVEAGRSGGGNAYGYRVVRRLGADGQPRAGARAIDAAEAAVVTRIFRAYAAGVSPKRIAFALNADDIPGPRGGAWSQSTLSGNRARGTGILNNELYIGRLVWNRLAYVKDPESGRRRSRARTAEELTVTEVTTLRIVEPALWAAVKARQAALDARTGRGGVNKTVDSASEGGAVPFWSQQRPRYLFSGLMRCGVCGGGFSKVSKEHFGCSAARNKGPAACSNRRTIRRVVLEATVLDSLRGRLMDPGLFKSFVAAFTAEWNRLQGAAAAEQTARADELKRVTEQMERLVDAIANGTPPAMVNDRLAKLEQRRVTLEAEAATAAAPAPRLHPHLAETYRRKVADLVAALAAEDGAEARELVRGLVERVTLSPEGDGQRVEVRGELAAILALAQGVKQANRAVGGAGSGDVLVEQVKVVAGAGFEPAAFRL